MSETESPPPTRALVPQPPIIDTIKGRIGEKTIFVPVDSKGKPLVPKEEEGYNQRGKNKGRLPKGEILDTEA